MKKIALLMAASLAVTTPAFAQKGATLRVVGSNHPWTDAMENLLPKFEQETGIRIVLEKYGEDQLSQKLTTEFAGGGSAIDVFMTRPLQESRLMKKNGWYADLSSYIGKESDYDFDDFAPSAREATVLDDFVTSIPLVTEAQVLYYRKDLLEAKGIKPPTTIDELYAAAEKLTEKSKDMYGFVARGQRAPLVTQFSSYLYSYGGDFFDRKTNKATIDTPEALAAMDMYGKLLREFGPPGVLNMSWPQAVAIFAQGKVALYTDASVFWSNILDPTKSTVADKTGVVVFPKGPKGAKMYNITSWGLAISAASKQKDAAWTFVKYMTDKNAFLFIQGEKAVQGARQSVWKTQEGIKKFPADWAKAIAESSEGMAYDRPLLTAVGAARDLIGEVVVASIEGKDFKKIATEANKRFQALLDKEK